mgnify:CR=1 FL=1
MFDTKIYNSQYNELSTKKDTILNSKDPIKSLELLIIDEAKKLLHNATRITTYKMTQEEENSRLEAIFYFYDMTMFDIIIKQERELKAIKEQN